MLNVIILNCRERVRGQPPRPGRAAIGILLTTTKSQINPATNSQPTSNGRVKTDNSQTHEINLISLNLINSIS